MKLKNFNLEKFDGSVFDFYEFTKDSYALIFFFRGAWCNLCKKQLLEAQQKIDFFDKKNIKLVAIAPDSKFKLSIMKTFLKVKFPILADEKFEVIDSLDLRVKYKSHETSKPAVFIVNPNHEIVYQYVGEDYDDRVSIKKVIDEIEKLADFR